MLYFISQVALMTLTSGNYHYQVRQLPQQVFPHKLVPKPSSSQDRYSYPSHKIFFGFLCPKLTSNIYDNIFYFYLKPYLKVIEGWQCVLCNFNVNFSETDTTRLYYPFWSYVQLFRKSSISTRQVMGRGFQEYLFI